jgi:hypothetical protein
MEAKIEENIKTIVGSIDMLINKIAEYKIK